MSEANILKGELRENTGKSFTKSARKEGNVPCIVYGDKKDPVAVNINFELSALKRIFDQKSQLSEIDLDGNHMLDKTFLIWADASKNLSSGMM